MFLNVDNDLMLWSFKQYFKELNKSLELNKTIELKLIQGIVDCHQQFSVNINDINKSLLIELINDYLKDLRDREIKDMLKDLKTCI
jgi:hypothetical protein